MLHSGDSIRLSRSQHNRAVLTSESAPSTKDETVKEVTALTRPDDNNRHELLIEKIDFHWKHYTSFLASVRNIAAHYPNLVQVDAFDQLVPELKYPTPPDSETSLHLTARIRLKFPDENGNMSHNPLRILIVSGAHAREHLAIQVTQGIVSQLVHGLLHTGMENIKDVIIDIVPVLNVYGYFGTADDRLRRKPDYDQTDLARDWPSLGVVVGSSSNPEKEDYRGRKLLSSIEVRCLYAILEQSSAKGEKYTLAVDLHSYGNVVVRVPGYDINEILHKLPNNSPNHSALQAFRALLFETSSTYISVLNSFAKALFHRSYNAQQDQVGYNVSGDMCDFMYFQYHTLSFVAELGDPRDGFEIGQLNKDLLDELPTSFVKWLSSKFIIETLRAWKVQYQSA